MIMGDSGVGKSETALALIERNHRLVADDLVEVAGGRGPLQERASYWFYRKMGLQYSRQEYIRPILNGRTGHNYEDVQKIDGDYVQAWFPDDAEGYIHKIDDYFEYDVQGTNKSNLDEGLKYDSRQVGRGDAFFALRGDVHDGHQYIAGAIASGGACSVR